MLEKILKRLRLPLRWQLIIVFVPLILLPVLVTLTLARGITEQGLKMLVTERAQRRAVDLASRISIYYEENGSWGGVSQALVVPPWLPFVQPFRALNDKFDPPLFKPVTANITRPEQILVVDAMGNVVAGDDENVMFVGRAVSPDVLAQGVPINVAGQPIGKVIIGEALGLLNEQQQQTLSTLSLGLITSGGLAATLAIGFAMLVSWQITRPVQQLMVGVKRLAAREWNEPLQIVAHNEFGELTTAFNHMAHEVTRQEAIRRQMVADVAHDLRTPLTAMLLEIEAIEAGIQTPTQAAASLREEAEWLQRLVDDLRLLSLMDADQVHLVKSHAPLYPFLSGVHEFFTPLAEDHARKLIFDAPPDLPAPNLDTGRMRQVIGNLIDNAIRHTQPGGTITLQAVPEKSGALIRVIDDGEGIKTDDLPHIFDRFYRADRSRRHEKHGGSGLGLSIAQRLVELHGGSIRVESEPGRGACFSVWLPA
jgi:signal transduction histidine kinase